MTRGSLWYLAVSLYCLLVLPRLLSYGMFLDGVAYASIARNMAEHYGSFWQPYYTATVYPTFYEHPPLGFWLQSWAYRLCGDSVYVEALWGFGVGWLILAGLAGIWRCLTPQRSTVAGAWFPLMLFVVMPMTSWALANNLLENTMTCFIVLAVWLCILSLQNPHIGLSCLYGICSGLSIFCAMLIKGPVALFPLAIPGLSILYGSKKIKICTTLCLLITTLAVAFGLMFSLSAASLQFWKRYVNQQVLASVTGGRETSLSRFEVFTVVSRESLVPLLVGGILTAAVYRLQKSRIAAIHPRLFLFYLGIALAGSLPILISAKQKRWYAFPALPFYAMAIAVVFNDVALALENLVDTHKNMRKNIAIFSSIILSIAIYFMLAEKNALRRDKDFHADFPENHLTIEERSIVSVYPEHIAKNWTLVANMQREFKASLSENFGYQYLLTTVEYINSEYISVRYQRIPPFHTKKYVLFKLDE
jgi:hypothetical protein